MKTRLFKLALVFIAVSLTLNGCVSAFDRSLKQIVKPYKFSLLKWELVTAMDEIRQVVSRKAKVTGSDSGVSTVKRFFAINDRMNYLMAQIASIEGGYETGDIAPLESELGLLNKEKSGIQSSVERIIERQIRDALSSEGVYHPLDKYIKTRTGFPPMNFELAKPPNLFVISPKNEITRLSEVMLLPEMSEDEMEKIEDAADKLNVSSLVVELGGIATYPAFVDATMDLRYTFDAASEEWFHQYLTFKPLGFLYVLDNTGIRRNYEIATINETVASMLGKEIGGLIYQKYYASEFKKVPLPEGAFDFNKEMREIRKQVDAFLAGGKVKEAEDFMVERRDYLARHGYYIRKLNQAYFAFHGAYADSPTSIDPIGVEVRELRNKSPSLKEFLRTASVIKSRDELKRFLAKFQK